MDWFSAWSVISYKWFVSVRSQFGTDSFNPASLQFFYNWSALRTTVESRFLELPKETQIGSRNREFKVIGDKITVKQIQFGSTSYRVFLRNRGLGKYLDSTVFSILNKYFPYLSASRSCDIETTKMKHQSFLTLELSLISSLVSSETNWTDVLPITMQAFNTRICAESLAGSLTPAGIFLEFIVK